MRIESVMTPRLLAIAESVPHGASVADVGTDHGYIPIYLCLKNKITKALAMDLRPGPLNRAEENISRFHLADCIKTRLSNGLAELSCGEADTAVIAGMGGLLIAEILEAAPFKLACYVLQPMTATAELRQFLHEHGYQICDETLAREEEKIYTVITVKHGEMTVENPVHYLVGQRLIEKKDPLLPELLESLLAKYKAMHEGLLLSDRAETKEKAEECLRLIESLEELKKECQAW